MFQQVCVVNSVVASREQKKIIVLYETYWCDWKLDDCDFQHLSVTVDAISVVWQLGVSHNLK